MSASTRCEEAEDLSAALAEEVREASGEEGNAPGKVGREGRAGAKEVASTAEGVAEVKRLPEASLPTAETARRICLPTNKNGISAKQNSQTCRWEKVFGRRRKQ